MRKYNMFEQMRMNYYQKRIFIRGEKKTIDGETLNFVTDITQLIKKIDNRVLISGLKVYLIDEKPRILYNARLGGYYKCLTNEVFLSGNLYKGKYYYYVICAHEILHFIHRNKHYGTSLFSTDFDEGITNLLAHWLIWKSGWFPNYTEDGVEIKPKYEAYIKEMKIVKKVIKRANLSMKDVFYNYCMHNFEFFEKFVPQKYFKH